MKKHTVHSTGEMLPDGSIIELIYDSEKDSTAFVVAKDGNITACTQYKYGNNVYRPYSAKNSLIKNNVVLLPSDATEYDSLHELANKIQTHIHTYLDVSTLFEKLCTHYILLSWVYDGFSQLPYIRKCGDFGTGKTRFLTVIGSLCYKPIFASGASSTPAIFHTLDTFKGTLILDEADFRYSDEKADISKVLNNGFSKGYPVLRCAFTKNKEFDPVAYQVYGCKVLASRKHFHDPALESRFISETNSVKTLRNDIPHELPINHESEARELRNKLLMYRFKTLKNIREHNATTQIPGVEPRISQVFSPLLEVATDDGFKHALTELAVQYSRQIKTDRAASIEYHVLVAIQSLIEKKDTVSIGNITEHVCFEYSDFHERKITARWIGYVVSKSLNLKTYKSSGRFYIKTDQQDILNALYVRYGLSNEAMS